jgi:diacylglycerol kinase family enzyme
MCARYFCIVPRRYHVLVNAAAGSVGEVTDRNREIVEAFARYDVDADVEPVEPDQLGSAMQRAWRRTVDAVVVAGGDGTVSSAAGTAVEHHIVLGVLPLGTFNHFAKDLGVPDGLDEAVAFLAGAVPTAVDVGEVNGRVFVNNASIGVYPTMVTVREDIRERRGWGKIRAAPLAIVRTLRRLPVHHLTLQIDHAAPMVRQTPFLFIGNGLFDVAGGQLGERTSMSEGVLGVYVIATTSRLALVRNAIRSRFGGVRAAEDTERHRATELLVRSADRTVPIALDGEPMDLGAALHFRSLPGALLVLGAG